MSVPGQTAGLSVFTDPLIDQLGITRTGISLSYLIGTLIGAATQPLIGRALDHWGTRRVTFILAVVFSMTLVALSLVSEVVGLTAGFVGVRMLGQGALGLAATTAVARAIHYRRGLALGLASAIGSGGISLAPLFLEQLVASVGIHDAWRWEALAVLVVVAPLALAFPASPRSRPSTMSSTDAIEDHAWTLPQATRTGMFWVIASSLAVSGALSTGLAFHQIAILGAQGLSPFEAAANFLPQTVTSIGVTLITGALIDRMNPKIFIAFGMSTLALSLLILPIVTPGWMAIGYGLILGAAGGSLRGMEAASYVRYYGVTHIGSIRGVATSVGLAATALGPLAFALGYDLTSTFTLPAALFAVLPIGVIVAALVVPPPKRMPPLRSTDAGARDPLA